MFRTFLDTRYLNQNRQCCDITMITYNYLHCFLEQLRNLVQATLFHIENHIFSHFFSFEWERTLWATMSSPESRGVSNARHPSSTSFVRMHITFGTTPSFPSCGHLDTTPTTTYKLNIDCHILLCAHTLCFIRSC